MNFCKSRYIEVVLMRSTLDVQVFEMDKCYDDIFRERCHMMDRFGEINRYFNSMYHTPSCHNLDAEVQGKDSAEPSSRREFFNIACNIKNVTVQNTSHDTAHSTLIRISDS
jgi:hypothetical protein